MTRSYSDPSYGSKKLFSFTRVSMGTRSDDAEIVEGGRMELEHPITVLGWNITCDATGDGGTSMWTLRDGTTILGTLNFVTNPTTGTTVSAAFATPTTLSTGDTLRLYSATSVADPGSFALARVEYREAFVESDS